MGSARCCRRLGVLARLRRPGSPSCRARPVGARADARRWCPV